MPAPHSAIPQYNVAIKYPAAIDSSVFGIKPQPIQFEFRKVALRIIPKIHHSANAADHLRLNRRADRPFVVRRPIETHRHA